jgi:hypothetical protein
MMRTIKIVLEVDVDDIDWGKSDCTPVGNGLFDIYIDDCKYNGKVIDFKYEDQACEYLEFLYAEADPNYGMIG